MMADYKADIFGFLTGYSLRPDIVVNVCVIKHSRNHDEFYSQVLHCNLSSLVLSQLWYV